MRKLDRIFFGGLAVVMIGFIMGGVLVSKAAPRGDIYEYLTNFREVLHLVNSSYVDDVETHELLDGAFKGMMESLDASSVYLDPAQHARYRQGPAPAVAGVGLTISKRFTYAVIVSVAPHSPAAEVGLRAGDLIRTIDGQMVREMNRLEVEKALEGDVDSEVLLSVIYHQSAERDDVSLVRRKIEAAPPELVQLSGGVGYLKLHHLGPGASDQVAALFKGKMAGSALTANSLILDLRNNPGNLLEESVAVADLFLSSGTIVTVKGQKGEGVIHKAQVETTCFQGEVAILVDRGTASGAEVVAAALQKNGRGRVVGEQSFGLGSEQELIPLSNGGALLLSVIQYYSPDGEPIPDQGVMPDEEVEPNGEEEEAGPLSGYTAEGLASDRYVKRALELLQTAGQEEPVADQAA